MLVKNMNDFVFDNNFYKSDLDLNTINVGLYEDLKPVMRDIFVQLKGLALEGKFGDISDIDRIRVSINTNTNSNSPYIEFVSENYRIKTRFRINIIGGPYPPLTLSALQRVYNNLPTHDPSVRLTIAFFYQQFRSALKKMMLTEMYLNGKIDFDTYTKKINKI